MDKVRVALRFLAKYHFWFLAALVVLVTLPLWWIGTSAIAKDYETSKAAIEGSYGKVNGISPENPNDTFKQAVDAEHEKLKKATQAAWQRQYDQQTPIFVWPDLPLDFRKRVTALKPADEIPIDLRDVYQNNIAEEVPKVWERCRLRRPKPLPPRPSDAPPEENAQRNPRIPGPSEGPVEDPMEGIVVWTGRTELEKQALNMRRDRPSTPEIRFFQEDLWIHEVLLRIVDAVNEKSTEPYNARIKQITDLAIGAAVPPPVATSADQLFAADSGRPGAMRPGGGGYGGPGKSGMSSGSGDEEGSSAPPDMGALLENNRYVDKTGAQQASGSADTHSNGVFKLIPAEMTLTMEEAAVPQLLAACANSPIPVEVRKVTIRGRSGPALAAASPGGRPGGLSGVRPGGSGLGAALPPGVGGAGKGGGPGKGGGESAREDIMGASEERSFTAFQPTQVAGGNEVAELAPTDVEVYLRVHIYIFNPPDPTKLNLADAATEGETAVDDESAASETPEPTAPPEGAAPNDTPPAAEADAEATPAAGESSGEAPPPAEAPPADAPPTEEPMPDGGAPTAGDAPAAEPAPGESPPAEGAGGAAEPMPPAEPAPGSSP